MTANTTINVFPTSTTGVAPHDDLVVTPRLSPLNIPENEREVSRIRERLNRRDELIKVDKKIIEADPYNILKVMMPECKIKK